MNIRKLTGKCNMKWFFHKLKYELFYKFGRKYKYCFDCLKKYKLTKVEHNYKRCSKCHDKWYYGRQG